MRRSSLYSAGHAAAWRRTDDGSLGWNSKRPRAASPYSSSNGDDRPGERPFIDYAGQTVGVTDDDTGKIRTAQVFVAVLGAAN